MPVKYGFKIAAAAMMTTWATHQATAAQAGAIPIPHIFFQGMDVTNIASPIEVAVGQKITLTADQNGASQSWTLAPGSVTYKKLAVFDKSPKCAEFPNPPKGSCVIYSAADFGQPETTFYFVSPNTYQITYTYTESDGTKASSATTFKAEGPTSISVKFQTGSVQIVPQAGCTSACYLAFGNQQQLNSPGIEMDVVAKQPKGIPGRFLWSQTIGVNIGFYANGQSYECPDEQGLDSMFPYLVGKVFGDAPNFSLEGAGLSQLTEVFSGFTSLLWQPKKSDYVLDSTPVVLGVATWGWSGSAAVFPNGQGWNVTNSYVAQPAYYPYPQFGEINEWDEVIPNGYAPICQAQLLRHG